MAVEKLSVSLEPELAQRTREAADASGRSVSAFVALAVEHQLKLETGPASARGVGGGARRDLGAGAGAGEVALAGLTLDTGALIAADRNDREFWVFWSEAVTRGIVPFIPAPALAQAWRGSRQARLAQLVNACFIDPLDETPAKAAGELCGQTKTADIVDASVVAGAASRGDAVLTSDPRDLRRLAGHTTGVEIIKL